MAKLSQAKSSVDSEPIIDADNYNISLSIALNQYNEKFSLSEYKQAALQYASSILVNVAKNIPEIEFRSIGAVCQLLLRDQYIAPNHIQYVLDRLKELSSRNIDKVVAEPLVQTVKKDEVGTNVALESFVADLNYYLEDCLLLGDTGETSESLVKKFAELKLKAADSKKIIQIFESYMKKYQEIDTIRNGVDEYSEVYKHITTQKIKKAIKSLEELKNSLKIVNTATKITKISKKSEKPAYTQVQNVKYAKEFGEIKSIHPKNVIGCSEVWIFDTEYRDLIVLRATRGLKITAEGTTFKNLDEDLSVKRKLRKPEEVLNKIISSDGNKTTFKKLFEELTTTEQKTSGRMSENRLIIKAFK